MQNVHFAEKTKL